MLYRAIYSSEAAAGISEAEAVQIQIAARRNNQQRGVSGVLIFDGAVFCQVLEGEQSVVTELLSKIESDPRHANFKVFHRADIEERVFSDWSMAYLSANPATLADWTEMEGTTTVTELAELIEADQERLPKVLIAVVQALASSAGAAQ